ncbi:tRNA (adenosine(37)-N6)-threonylcarbamoyltransferase complex dimerization subunit type 1 TsaB [Candidatus Finniella inopinata]|uniref:tRNA (Adenosine(37)-N6)-threonylcarbamoyltransferase complex dimerization subunit type 1 TsaB n=1 Tax=Candidatus Finniella inopinata TaxID=1696036 RepID=A0A4Q7DG81_9PROT|nr:tRNA (adenosine(37)-N6)-threonylcarbamoyltransferase complex dimerization subunit type 1 TsaB [Candidatus Finniella inopinata]RZI45662.1 tRNA (adenosine(37)-N6)-threonylcarbamoyltransferase complex dimerization subunit type 1 TsaB [Candidatus Finniella inopinata]
MTTLSLYAQNDQCQVALKADERVYAESVTLTPTVSQAMALVPLIQRVWQQAGSPDIDAIITARGPGTFTSLRVTLATAQGLAMAFPGAQIFAPTHFDVLGYAARQLYQGPILVLIDSRRGDWYGQVYGEIPTEIQIFKAPDLHRFLQQNPACRLMADFEVGEGLQTHLIDHPLSLALTQLQLFEDANFQNLKTNPLYQDLKPYYYYQPAYVKKR